MVRPADCRNNAPGDAAHEQVEIDENLRHQVAGEFRAKAMCLEFVALKLRQAEMITTRARY
jgi:hypothetical protein